MIMKMFAETTGGWREGVTLVISCGKLRQSKGEREREREGPTLLIVYLLSRAQLRQAAQAHHSTLLAARINYFLAQTFTIHLAMLGQLYWSGQGISAVHISCIIYCGK